MIPLVHLSDCPEPPAYVPDEECLVVHLSLHFQPPAIFLTSYEHAAKAADKSPYRKPSDSYRMF